jgi:hypothetical protein
VSSTYVNIFNTGTFVGSTNNDFVNVGGGTFTKLSGSYYSYTFPGPAGSEQLWLVDYHVLTSVAATGVNGEISFHLGIVVNSFDTGVHIMSSQLIPQQTEVTQYYCYVTFIRWFTGGSFVSFVVGNGTNIPITISGTSNVAGTTVNMQRLL